MRLLEGGGVGLATRDPPSSVILVPDDAHWTSAVWIKASMSLKQSFKTIHLCHSTQRDRKEVLLHVERKSRYSLTFQVWEFTQQFCEQTVPNDFLLLK